MKTKTYRIEFLDSDNNEHFTKVKPFSNKKEAIKEKEDNILEFVITSYTKI